MSSGATARARRMREIQERGQQRCEAVLRDIDNGNARIQAEISDRQFSPMSEVQLKAFLEAVKNDAEIQEKLKAATDADAIAAIAQSAGFAISAEEAERFQIEIPQEEIEYLAGGSLRNTNGGSNCNYVPTGGCAMC